LLENKTDLVGLAKTGTGKTAAFGLPLLQLIDTKHTNVQAVILVPTRELGHQIFY
jgi:ATP-dependent RNA helicase DeaD